MKNNKNDENLAKNYDESLQKNSNEKVNLNKWVSYCSIKKHYKIFQIFWRKLWLPWEGLAAAGACVLVGWPVVLLTLVQLTEGSLNKVIFIFYWVRYMTKILNYLRCIDLSKNICVVNFNCYRQDKINIKIYVLTLQPGAWQLNSLKSLKIITCIYRSYINKQIPNIKQWFFNIFES